MGMQMISDEMHFWANSAYPDQITPLLTREQARGRLGRNSLSADLFSLVSAKGEVWMYRTYTLNQSYNLPLFKLYFFCLIVIVSECLSIPKLKTFVVLQMPLCTRYFLENTLITENKIEVNCTSGRQKYQYPFFFFFFLSLYTVGISL